MQHCSDLSFCLNFLLPDLMMCMNTVEQGLCALFYFEAILLLLSVFFSFFAKNQDAFLNSW